ncbi:single-stranded DNA-binding protein [Comamonas sp. NyZ500]|uniref:single-stranded DNA-binding protein n=1 Tax=Comamonas sp. NyZ500 TaxID=2795732 RepID=UPI00192B8B2C|nr:single-stranded DNA-binding protein [Comamonas sp. NyZ500]MBL5980260.1 single-stranded DNA-binding protein [Comamonas sp. NyZ500]
MSQLFIGKGNLANSPTLQTLPGGANGTFDVASMRVYFGRYGRNDNGEIEQKGGYWREVEIYGAKARDAARLLRKGSRVLVMGQEREYMARDEGTGGQVMVFKIAADDVALLLSRVKSIEFEPPRRSSTEQSDGFTDELHEPHAAGQPA